MITPKQDYFDTPEGIRIKEQLTAMDVSEGHVTKPSYSPNTEKYADNLIPFVEKHMMYIRSHPQVNPSQYVSNLQILTRVR